MFDNNKLQLNKQKSPPWQNFVSLPNDISTAAWTKFFWIAGTKQKNKQNFIWSRSNKTVIFFPTGWQPLMCTMQISLSQVRPWNFGKQWQFFLIKCRESNDPKYRRWRAHFITIFGQTLLVKWGTIARFDEWFRVLWKSVNPKSSCR